MQFGSMSDVAIDREGKAAGGRVAAPHCVWLCCGGGWKASHFARVEKHVRIPCRQTNLVICFIDF
jgi:hypothetical protein